MTTPYYYVGPNRSPYRQPSPFLPPVNLTSSPYGSPYSSPYRASVPLPTGSPNNPPRTLPGTPNTPFREYNPYPQYYNNQAGWDRQRRNSFSGPSDDGYVPSWIAGYNRQPPVGAYPPYQQTSGYWGPGSPYASSYINKGIDIHPLLNGDSPQNVLIFDLSAPKLQPLKQFGPGQTAYITETDLAEPATWPGLNSLRIECDLIPQWPIAFDLDPNYFGGQSPPAGTAIPPITLNDILVKIYDHFQHRISHLDWASLSPQDESRIAKAYTARCKALGTAEAIERSQGVKRIDYCLGNIWFRGLTRSGEGMDVLKLHLEKRVT